MGLLVGIDIVGSHVCGVPRLLLTDSTDSGCLSGIRSLGDSLEESSRSARDGIGPDVRSSVSVVEGQ